MISEIDDATVDRAYARDFADLKTLLDGLTTLSIAIHEQETESEHTAIGSRTVTKLLLHGIAIYKLAPTPRPQPDQIWDLSSLCVLARAIIDSYLIFFYLCVEGIAEDEKAFRMLVWHHHAKKQRVEQLQLLEAVRHADIAAIQAEISGCKEEASVGKTRLTKLREELAELEAILTQIGNARREIENLIQSSWADISRNSCFVGSGDPDQIKRWKSKLRDVESGRRGILLTNSDIAQRAGVNVNYYNIGFNHMSQFVHGLPMAHEDMIKFRADDPASRDLYDRFLSEAVSYLALTLRSCREVFPGFVDGIPTEVWRRVELRVRVFCGGAIPPATSGS